MSRVYFTDRDLGKQFPRLLAEAGLTVERPGDLSEAAGHREGLPACARRTGECA